VFILLGMMFLLLTPLVFLMKKPTKEAEVSAAH